MIVAGVHPTDLPIARRAAPHEARTFACVACRTGLAVDTGPGAPERVRCPHCGAEQQIGPRRVVCPGCGAGVVVRAGVESRVVTCSACDGFLDVSTDVPRVLVQLAERRPPDPPPIAIGRTLRLLGATFEVLGWVRYRGEVDGQRADYDELLVFAPEAGFRSLEIAAGHASVGRRVFDGPRLGDPIDAEPSVEHRGRRHRVAQQGATEVVHAEGEVPWITRVGHRNRTLDAARAPVRLRGAWSSNGSAWFRYEYLTREALLAALGGPLDLPEPAGIAAHQPYPEGRLRWLVGATAGVGATAVGATLVAAPAALSAALWGLAGLGALGLLADRWTFFARQRRAEGSRVLAAARLAGGADEGDEDWGDGD